MGCYKYAFTALATSDIDEALAYISDNLKNNAAARALYNQLIEALNNACEFPMMYPSCEIYLVYDENIRHASVGNYSLIYEVCNDKKELHVLRFLYQKVDIGNTELK